MWGESAMSSSIADLAALGKLIEEHRPRLLAMLQRRIDPKLRARVDPEDILADAFLAAQGKWARYKQQPAITPYAWLYRIVLDSLSEAWRKQNRQRRRPDKEMPWPERSSIELGLGLVNTGTSPSAAVARKELGGRMQQTLALLGPRDQEILWMRHY